MSSKQNCLGDAWRSVWGVIALVIQAIEASEYHRTRQRKKRSRSWFGGIFLGSAKTRVVYLRFKGESEIKMTMVSIN